MALSHASRTVLQAALLLGILTGISRAAGDVPATAEIPGAAAEDIAAAVRLLRSEDYAMRAEATQILINFGEAAIGPVAKAAESGDLETSSRCLEILKRMRTGTGNSKSFSAAEKALEQLAKSRNKSVAQRAAAITWKPDPNEARNLVFGAAGFRGRVVIAGAPAIVPAPAVPVDPRTFQREVTVVENEKRIVLRETVGRELNVKVTEMVEGKPKTTEYKAANSAELRTKHPRAYEWYVKHLRGKPFQQVANQKPLAGPRPAAPVPVPAGPNVQIQIAQGGAAGNFRMQVTNVNGKRQVEVEENGKKTSISDESGKNIQVKVTESKDGKETSREYNAADIEELKKKHPEGAQLYEKYAKPQANGIRAVGNGGVIQIEAEAVEQAIPAQAIPARALPIRINRRLPEQNIEQPAIPAQRP